MTHVRLRVAVSTDGPIVRWQARCVEALAAVPGVTLECWVQLSADRPPGRARTDSRALTAVPVPDALRALRPEDCTISTPPDSEPARPVDVLLDLTSRGLALPVSWASEVWRFGYGHTLSRDPARAALIDYVRGPGLTRVALVTEPAGAIVREGWLRTASWWNCELLERLLLDPADWLATAALERTDPALVADAASRNGGDKTTHAAVGRAGRHNRAAGLPQPLLEVAAAGRRMLEVADKLVRHPDWNIGIVQAPIERMLAADEGQAITWLPARRGRYAADPFGLERDGVLHVFFEDFDQRRGRGSISHIAIAPNGTMSDPECVLDPGVHASYPFLVEHAGAVFMLPETAAAGELVLYEAVDFPHRWRPAITLLSGIPAVDASVIEHAGRWWMFAGRHDQGPNHSLFVWHAPQLTGPWTPHAANPVKTDARSARSGGTPFVSAGQLYRPSQDDSLVYGGRVVLNRVDVLTPTAFAERPVRAIGPRPGSRYPDGLHTLSAAGDRTLIDGNVRHFVRDALRLKVAGQLPGRRSS
jgi:hypothetical protein